MRSSAITGLLTITLSAMTITIAACATAPIDDDLSGLTQAQQPNDPADQEQEQTSAKLPPPSNTPKDPEPPKEEKDAGPADTGTKDTGTPDTGTPDTGTPPPTTGDDCDPNDMTYYMKFVMSGGAGATCPCVATQCCYLGVACLDK